MPAQMRQRGLDERAGEIARRKQHSRAAAPSARGLAEQLQRGEPHSSTLYTLFFGISNGLWIS